MNDCAKFHPMGLGGCDPATCPCSCHRPPLAPTQVTPAGLVKDRPEPPWRKGDRERNAVDLATKVTRDAAGLIRWTSNGRIPYDDVLIDAGLTPDVWAEHKRVRDAEGQAFLADYRKKNRRRRYSAEEKAEMRANFGKGTTVVDVLTGRRIRL